MRLKHILMSLLGLIVIAYSLTLMRTEEYGIESDSIYVWIVSYVVLWGAAFFVGFWIPFKESKGINPYQYIKNKLGK